MSAPALAAPCLPATNPTALQQIRALEAAVLERPQTPIATHHVIHAGLYARTIRIPAGVLLTGAEIKRATLVILSGHALVTTDGAAAELAGYHVLPASAGRKTAFLALADTDLTMLFPTASRTVAECEAEFTDEADRLMSRAGENVVIITED